MAEIGADGISIGGGAEFSKRDFPVLEPRAVNTP